MMIPIPNFTKYAATDDGKIVRIDTGKILFPRKLKNGYFRVYLTSDDGKRKDVLVHRAVCLTFNGNPSADRFCVNHKNADKADNRPSNLEWCSYAENMSHASMHHLLDSQCQHMRIVNLMRRKRVVGKNKNNKIVYDFPSIQSARDNGHSSVSYSIRKNTFTREGVKWELQNIVEEESNA